MNFHISCLSNEPSGKQHRGCQEEVATFHDSRRAHAPHNRIKTNLLFAFVMFARKMLCVVFFFPGCANCIRPANPCVWELPLFARLFTFVATKASAHFSFFRVLYCTENIRNLYIRRSLCSRRKDSKAFLFPRTKRLPTQIHSDPQKNIFFPCIAMLLHASVEKKLNRVTIVLPPNETLENKMCWINSSYTDTQTIGFCYFLLLLFILV